MSRKFTIFPLKIHTVFMNILAEILNNFLFSHRGFFSSILVNTSTLFFLDLKKEIRQDNSQATIGRCLIWSFHVYVLKLFSWGEGFVTHACKSIFKRNFQNFVKKHCDWQLQMQHLLVFLYDASAFLKIEILLNRISYFFRPILLKLQPQFFSEFKKMEICLALDDSLMMIC